MHVRQRVASGWNLYSPFKIMAMGIQALWAWKAEQKRLNRMSVIQSPRLALGRSEAKAIMLKSIWVNPSIAKDSTFYRRTR